MKTLYIGNTGETPLGEIWVAVLESGLVAVDFPSTREAFTIALKRRHTAEVVFDLQRTAEAVRQLREYAAGERRTFTLPIDWSGMGTFQQNVLELTRQIPYGETRTYQHLAAQLGNPRAARAVARAQATNPIPLVIPCHRVIGSDGALRGYGAGKGIATKQQLLDLEAHSKPTALDAGKNTP